MRIALRLAIYATVVTLGAPSLASDYVTVSATVEPASVNPGGAFTLAVKAVVAAGYHVGSADKEALSPAGLVVAAPSQFAFSKPVFPPGKWVRFEFATEKVPVYEGEFTVSTAGRVSKDAEPGTYSITAVLNTQACKDDQCFPPEDTEVKVELRVCEGEADVSTDAPDARASDEEETAATLAKAGMLKRLALIYLGGLLLAFTPCVYPMIPVTVGYFSSQGERQKRKVTSLALVYVLGIAVTYAALGTAAASTGGALGSVMQSPAVLIGIAVLLAALALSMFGLYELRVPGFIQDRASSRSGIAGALFMGLIFGLVAAPCAGPFTLGLAVYAAKVGSPLIGFLMFFVLAIGMGTPLFALAAFSAKLPAPGMWMLTVERIGGFILLGAAAYFVGPVLPELIRPYLLSAVVLATGVYIGFVDKSLKSTRTAAVAGKALCAVFVAAAVYLAWPARAEVEMDWTAYTPGAVADAAREGRPSIVDFAADWCIACKELDHGPWSDPDVLAAAEGFARFRVDGTRRTAEVKAMEDELGVKGAYPTVLFFDATGREVRGARITGFVDSNEMIRRMEMAR